MEKSVEWTQLKQIINQINDIKDVVLQRQKLSEILLSDSNIQKHQVDKSGNPLKLYQVFNSFIYDIVFGRNVSEDKLQDILNGSAIKRIEQSLKESGFDRIPYELQLMRENEGGTVDQQLGLMKIVVGDTKYTIRGINGEELPFMLYGKLDSTEFYGNITPLINDILQKCGYDPNVGGSKSRMFQDLVGFTNKYKNYNSELEKIDPIFADESKHSEFGRIKSEAIEKLNQREDLIYAEDENGLIHIGKFNRSNRELIKSEETENFIRFKLSDNFGNYDEILFAKKNFEDNEQVYDKGQFYKINNTTQQTEKPTIPETDKNITLLKSYLEQFGIDTNGLDTVKGLLDKIILESGLPEEEILQYLKQYAEENPAIGATFENVQEEICLITKIAKY